MNIILLILVVVFHNNQTQIKVVQAPSMAVCESVKPDLIKEFTNSGALQVTVECHEVKPNNVS